jgi:hypothetical protein
VGGVLYERRTGRPEEDSSFSTGTGNGQTGERALAGENALQQQCCAIICDGCRELRAPWSDLRAGYCSFRGLLLIFFLIRYIFLKIVLKYKKSSSSVDRTQTVSSSCADPHLHIGLLEEKREKMSEVSFQQTRPSPRANHSGRWLPPGRRGPRVCVVAVAAPAPRSSTGRPRRRHRSSPEELPCIQERESRQEEEGERGASELHGRGGGGARAPASSTPGDPSPLRRTRIRSAAPLPRERLRSAAPRRGRRPAAPDPPPRARLRFAVPRRGRRSRFLRRGRGFSPPHAHPWARSSTAWDRPCSRSSAPSYSRLGPCCASRLPSVWICARACLGDRRRRGRGKARRSPEESEPRGRGIAGWDRPGRLGAMRKRKPNPPRMCAPGGLLHFAAAFAVTAGVCTVLIPSPFCRFVGV